MHFLDGIVIILICHCTQCVIVKLISGRQNDAGKCYHICTLHGNANYTICYAFTFRMRKQNCCSYGISSVIYSTAALVIQVHYRSADKSFARPGRKQATVREDFEFHISYL
jgi:hypothetical protein